MHGFSPWPARISSVFEKIVLTKVKQAAKNADVAVTFYGLRNDRYLFQVNISLLYS
jgi:hypothetical protein